MSDLLWPGDQRAGTVFDQATFLQAMCRVETAWLAGLVAAELAPASALTDLGDLLKDEDVEVLADAAEGGGNPVIALVALLRSRAPADAAAWLHRGLTSQDVVDTALMLCLRETFDRLLDEQHSHVIALSILAERHRSTLMVGRTLTQQAVPTTFGAVAASWLDGIVDAAELAIDARALLPVQIGGAVGTLAATAEMAALRGLPHPDRIALDLRTRTAKTLGLRAHRPWHTSRGPVTRAGDALASCTDSWGHIATDVATLSRSEIGELAEPAGEGRGGSSTMPHKRNPVLSVLVRRAALSLPPLAATLHTASALTGDQRPDGSWHAEWSTLATMSRRAVIAASQMTEILQGLHVDVDRMRLTLDVAADDILGERRAVGALLGIVTDPQPDTYLGVCDLIVAGAVARARTFLEETP